MSAAARIQFDDDDIHGAGAHAGGVYSVRQRSPPGIGRIRSSSLSRYDSKESDIEAETNVVSERDIKQKQVFGGVYLLWLAYQSIGVIYGDIGTSPLYVYSSTFTADPSYEDLLGVLSLIIWSLTLIVTIKYCFIVLRADDQGEGGTFALYSLLSRFANIVRRDPREELTVKMERAKTNELTKSGRGARNFLERSRVTQYLLRTIGVFGVSLVMADGILTPAQSVLGAIQGLRVVNPDISTATIVGVSCTILVLLFLIQPFGTTKLASTFAPIVIVWLLFNFTFGIYNLAVHDASVLRAFSPYFAGSYLVRNGRDGWISLGGVLLCFTGVEALYADLGAFTRRAVQLSWLIFAFPCLLLGYIGQAAYISDDPSAWSNPFFNTVPPGMFYPSLIFAILAAVVASQAMITAVFQLLSQIMKLSYCPQIKVIHTSKIFHGQVYIPSVNWLLMIGTVIVTAVYNNTTRLGQAYGVCVIFVTFITTSMVALVAIIIWKIPSPVVLFVYLTFAALDGAYLSSALTKVPDGAWFTIVLAFLLSSFFVLWRFGKEQQWRAEASDRFPLSQMITLEDHPSSDKNHSIKFTPEFGGHTITRINGIGIFFDKAGDASTTPTVFIHFLQKFHAAPDVVVFFHLRAVPIPTVSAEERYTITRCSAGLVGQKKIPIPNTYRLVIRHGYTDEVITPELGALVHEQLRNHLLRERDRSTSQMNRSTFAKEPKDLSHEASSTNSSQEKETTKPTTTDLDQSGVGQKLADLQRAHDSQVVYLVGKEQMRLGPKTGLLKWLALTTFLWVKDSTRTKVQALNVEVEKLVEVGFVKEL